MFRTTRPLQTNFRQLGQEQRRNTKLWALLKRPSMGFAVLLGFAIGGGLLAKQAMIYVFLCIACHAAVSREAREAGRAIVAVRS